MCISFAQMDDERLCNPNNVSYKSRDSKEIRSRNNSICSNSSISSNTSIISGCTNSTGVADVTPSLNMAKHRQHEYTGGSNKYLLKPPPEDAMSEIQAQMDILPPQDQQVISNIWSLFSSVPQGHRNLILQGLLQACCPPELSFMASRLRELIRIDFISALPAEIVYKILSYLDATSLCRASQVSSKWRRMADDDVVWQRICAQHIDRKCRKCGWGLPLLERKRLQAAIEESESDGHSHSGNVDRVDATHTAAVCETEYTDMENEVSAKINTIISSSPENAEHGGSTTVTSADAAGSCCVELGDEFAPLSLEGSLAKRAHDEIEVLSTDVESSATAASTVGYPLTTFVGKRQRRLSSHTRRPWKDVYSERCKIERNWRRGRYKLKTLKGHTDGVMCLQLCEKNNVLATGSYDTTVKIWDLKTGEVVRTLVGHHRGVGALQFDDHKLISASMDGTLRVWNHRTGECLSVLRGHTDGVLCLHYDASLLCSGSADSTIRIWDFNTKECFNLRGHRDWVNSVRLSSTARTVISGSDDTTIRLWNLDLRECIRVFRGHVGQVQSVIPISPSMLPEHIDEIGNSKSMQIKQRDSKCISYTEGSSYIASSSLDNTIKIWRLQDGACVKTLFGHVEGVWALAADTLRLVSGGHDRTVKVWDVDRGVCEHTLVGHMGPVTCVGLSDSKVLSGGEDGTIFTWDFSADD